MKHPIAFALIAASLALFLHPVAQAEIIGVETFSYPDGPIADLDGGTFWDFDNTAGTHTGTASDWNNAFGSPAVSSGSLVTDNAGAIREYNGPGEGSPPSDMGDGAVNEGAFHKSVYYRVTVTTGATLPDWFGLSSYDFVTEKLFFGKLPGLTTFVLNEVSGAPNVSSTPVATNTTYTLVAKIDFAGDQIALFVNPDLNAAEPATPTATQAYTGTNWSTGLRLASGSGGSVTWDHLAVATTWTDLGTGVTTAADEDNGSLDPAAGGGAGISLREALNHSPAGSLVTFDSALSGQTLTLTGGQLLINKSLTVDASALPAGFTIDADGANTEHRVLEITPGSIVFLSHLTLTGGNATDNFPANRGGAIYSDRASLSLDSCTLSGNSATFGGGIFNNGVSGSATLSLSHSTLSGNSASTSGGGIYNNGSFGGTAPVTLNNSIVADNSATGATNPGPDIRNDSGTVTPTGVNLLSVLADSSLTDNANVNVGDPLLAPLGWYGGPTQTMPPLVGSPAIDAAGTTNPGGTDQRGFPRFTDGDNNATAALDIGAVEAALAILVDTATDENDGIATGGISLREALAAATDPGQRILFDATVFNGEPADTITLGGTELFISGAAPEGLFIDASNITTATGAPPGVTLSGNADANGTLDTGESRIFSIAAGTTVALRHLHLTQGQVDTTAPLSNSAGYGGAILSAGLLTLDHCQIDCCHAGAGGGIFNDGANSGLATLSLSHSTLSGNSADYGGGILNDGSNSGLATLTLFHSTLSGNSASIISGGIYNYGASGSATLTLFHSTLSGNSADYGEGGGIYNYGYSGSAPLTLSHSTLSGNSATSGGGIYNDGYDGSATLTLDHSTLSGNSATNFGGGIYNYGASGSAPVTLSNSIVAANSAVAASNPGPDILNDSGTVTPTGVNLLSDLTDSDLTEGSTVLLAADPLLAPLGWYGGPTQTMPPLPSSPAVDAATASTAPSDQRGASRPIDGDGNTSALADIGAVELQPTLVANADDSGSGSLRDAIAQPFVSTITFDPALSGQTLTLTGGQLLINKSLTVDASALPAGFTIDADSLSRVLEVSAGSTVRLRSLTLTGGRATSGGVGGLGGGIFSDGSLTLENSTLFSNTAIFGAGLFNGDPGDLTLIHCTVADNHALSAGGGIFNDGALHLRHVTVSGNSAINSGGGVFGSEANDSLSLENSIVAANSAPNGPDIRNNSGTVTPTGVNLLSVLADSDLTDDANVNVGDPLLAPLGWYGGPTRTMPPLADSPAIDAAGATDPGGADQRGFPRFTDGDNDATAALDIGAVEAAPIILVDTATDENDGIATGFTSLREALAAATDPGQRILFDPAVFDGQPADTITLTNGQLATSASTPKGLFIDASNITSASGAPTGVTIDADGANTEHRVLEITPGSIVFLSHLTLTGGNATDNFPADLGGAICNDHATLSLHASTLSGNSATNSGGGIFNNGLSGSATLSLSHSTLSGNSATNSGGGIFNNGNSGSATLSLSHSTLSGNSANFGGGIFNNGYTGSAPLSLSHSTLSGNSATNSGGGIFNQGFSGSATLNLTRSTLSGNSANSKGGGIFNNGFSGSAHVTLSNSIVAANSAVAASNPGPDILNDSGTVTPTGVNLLSDLADSSLSDDANVNVGDPLLSPLGWYGGLIQTMHPLAGSPAIDAAGPTTPGGTDQRGFPRFVDGTGDAIAALDIGAVEAAPIILVDTATDENDAPAAGFTSLREALAAATDPGQRILFDPTVFDGQPTDTITLTNGQLATSAATPKGLFIDASNIQNGVTIDADGANTEHRVLEITPGSIVFLSHLTLTGGNATGSSFPANSGGAIHNDRANLSLQSCTLSGNSASYYGGGIVNNGVSRSATLSLSHSTLSGNSATSGGGIYNAGSSGSAPLSLSHSTLSGNSATNSGGGIYNYGLSGSATLGLSHSTLSGNSASNQGGGIYNNGFFGSAHVTLSNSIVGNNSAQIGTDIDNTSFPGTVTPTGVNLLSDLADSSLSDDVNVNVGEPLLAPLGWYDGPTQTLPPLPGSPAIDAAGTTNPGGTDQRGFPRFAHGALDIGAVEFSASADLTPIWASNTDGDPNAYGIEFATGTSLDDNDPAHPNAFRITGTDGSGKPKLTFGLNPAAAPYTTWIVKRSTTLLPGSFTEIYRYHGPTMIETATGTTGTTMGNLLEVVDDNPPSSAAFYLFEADIAAP